MGGQNNSGITGLDAVAPLRGSFAQASNPRPAVPERSLPNPFGSITAGRHQFTLLGDNDHSDPSIVKGILDNIPAMAQSGIKHMLIEYAPAPETDQIIDQLYARPPAITYDQVREQAPLLNSTSPKTPEAQAESGRQYAELIINCHKHGLKVHFAGDTFGNLHGVFRDNALKQQQALVDENPVLHKRYLDYMENPDSLKAFGLSPERQAEFETTLLAHGEKFLGLGQKAQDSHEKFIAERMGPEAERKRADRFLDMAGTEKAVIMFGAEHHKYNRDLNEAIDERLQARALKNGTSTALEPTRVMDIHASRAALGNNITLGIQQNADAVYFVQEATGELTARDAELSEARPPSPPSQPRLQR